MPKRHSRSDSDLESARHYKSICISVDSYLRDRLGLETSPGLGNPYPVDRATVIDFLEKTASGDSIPAEPEREGSLAESASSG